MGCKVFSTNPNVLGIFSKRERFYAAAPMALPLGLGMCIMLKRTRRLA